MGLRLLLQPAWLRFVVWALIFAVMWGLITSLQSSYEFESAVLSAIVFGAVVGGSTTFATQGANRAALQAISGLDQAGRSQSIDAVLHGAVPDDPDVRAAAARLGRVLVRNRSADQLRRSEKWTWVMYVVLLVPLAAAATTISNDRLYYLVLGVFWAIFIPILLRRSRRIQRNVALLAEVPN